MRAKKKTVTKNQSPTQSHPGEVIRFDKRTLPRGYYKDVGFERQQVIDIKITAVITEYRAQIPEGDHDKRYVAPFPVKAPSPYADTPPCANSKRMTRQLSAVALGGFKPTPASRFRGSAPTFWYSNANLRLRS